MSKKFNLKIYEIGGNDNFSSQRNINEGELLMNKTIWEVSYELEKLSEKYFNCGFDHSSTFFDRDIIQAKTFYDVMYLLLHMHGGEGSIDFVNKYAKYQGIRMEDMPDYEKLCLINLKIF